MAPKQPAKPAAKAAKAELAVGLTPGAEMEALHGCINQQLFQKLQEDLACIQAHNLFNNTHKAEAADVNAKNKDSGQKSNLPKRMPARWP